MPLAELIPLGYELRHSPAQGMSVFGHGREFHLLPGGDEEALVAQAKNLATLQDKLVQARDYFSENYRTWPDLTAQQKDQANRQAQRALANICRRLLNDLTTPGD